MICERCERIPLGLFFRDTSIQYELHENLISFIVSANSGCHSCRLLLRQRATQLSDLPSPPNRGPEGERDGYWLEWDEHEDSLVLASGWNHYFIDYDSETGLRTTDIIPDLAPAASSESLAIIKTWIDKCLKEHDSCQSGNGILPTRLIDVGSTDNRQKIRIVENHQLAGQQARYFAFSYCWGKKTKESSWTLTQKNIEQFKTKISPDRLPRSFHDLIKLARALEVRYVWIDALCILQDSTDDWTREAGLMAHIYENALCTIVSPASDPTEPLFIERNPTLTRPATLNLSVNEGGPSLAVRFLPVIPAWIPNFEMDFSHDDGSGLKAKQPTRERAWCLQEFELSRRIVIFTTHQCIWLCREMQCSEEKFSEMSEPLAVAASKQAPKTHWTGFKLPLLSNQLLWWPFGLFSRAARLSSLEYVAHSSITKALFKRKIAEPPGLYQQWEKLVEEFTRRNLTQPADRISAIAGLAEKRQREMNDRYLMGLWENDLQNHLLWCVVDPGKTSKIPQLADAPTWSWVAVNAAVRFPRRPYSRHKFESAMPSPIGNAISIEEVKVEQEGQHPYTQVSPARITLEGRVIHGSMQNTKLKNPKQHFFYDWIVLDEKGENFGHVILDDTRFHVDGLSVECLWVDPGVAEDLDLDPEPERYTGGFGLALLRKPNATTQSEYIRIGFVQFAGQVIKWIHKVEIFTITIT
ncbi:heterokaryon incompatibility protein-domain-containing protein [Xylogone sp. PMI_703]|nr:heterokaryon incompatibility protein-domain-containing protein [Xylogone sp. PMI_703]